MKTVIKFLTTLLVASHLACNTREELGTEMICLNEIFVRHSINYEMMADFNYEKTALFGDSTTKLNLRGNLERYEDLARNYKTLKRSIEFFRDYMYDNSEWSTDTIVSYQKQIVDSQFRLNHLSDSFCRELSIKNNQLPLPQVFKEIDFSKTEQNGANNYMLFYLTAIQISDAYLLYWWSLVLFENAGQ